MIDKTIEMINIFNWNEKSNLVYFLEIYVSFKKMTITISSKKRGNRFSYVLLIAYDYTSLREVMIKIV